MTPPPPVSGLPPSVSPTRKRRRDMATAASPKPSVPLSRRLRMRIDHSERIWIGRCGCKSPHCTADDVVLSSDTGESDSSDDDDDNYDYGTHEPQRLDTEGETPPPDPHRPPQNPDDLVPMLLHLMLMM